MGNTIEGFGEIKNDEILLLFLVEARDKFMVMAFLLTFLEPLVLIFINGPRSPGPKCPNEKSIFAKDGLGRNDPKPPK